MAKLKPILAIVSVCAAAGVVTYDVSYFSGSTQPVQPAGPESEPTTPAAPLLAAVPTAPLNLPPAANRVDLQVESDASVAEPRDADLARLIQELVARNAERGPLPGAGERIDSGSGPESGSASSGDAWEQLDLRGVLLGEGRALALVNGRLLRVGDELPGVRLRIERILADRVVAAPFAGGATRTLTLRAFESPTRKRASSTGTTTTKEAASPAAMNGPTGETTAAPPSGSNAAAGSANGVRQQ